MAFSQATIQDITWNRRDAEIAIRWSSSSADGTWFQVYINQSLAWYGQARNCVLPMPSTDSGRQVQVDLGTVLPAEAHTDLSASLPAVAGGGQRVLLQWVGGTYLDPDIEGFHVYSGTVPGGAVNYSILLGTVVAYPGDIYTDGWGLGGWGLGGWGMSEGNYEWISPPMAPGVWNFAVCPFDHAGNEGTALSQSATLAGPPRPPARNAAGARLTYSLTTGPKAVLSWLNSPGF